MENDNAAEKKTSSSANALNVAKGVISLLRDIFLVIIVVLLFCNPPVINKRLIKAGFKKANIAGVEWVAEISEYDSRLKESQARITDLDSQLYKTTKVLIDAQKKLNDPSIQKQLDSLEKENKQFSAATKQLQKSATKTIASNAEIVLTAQEAENAGDLWGVVYSADVELSGAQYEIDHVAKLKKIPNATIYKRQGVYRSVSVVDDLEEANRVLKIARTRRSDAYIVPMSTWCPNSVDMKGYKECGSSTTSRS